MKTTVIPGPSKKRLVLLGRLLSTYKERTITSQKIQELTGWTAAAIRRDISMLNLHCGASNGYKVQELKAALQELVCTDSNKQKCCIIGLNRMGQVLLDDNSLYDSPFKIVAGFDSNVNRTEVLQSSFPLHPTTLLESIIRSEDIKYAILTAEGDEAQSLASRLAQCGIKGIVNYTSSVLTLPKTVAVENVCLLTALENLSAGNNGCF
ncbi:winged-helix domain-containing protein [Treponema sp.]|uniref:winged-helix domain-containing protein n=1 Tax=Treponema sp. TaxID=166 RepID=UPI002600218F|nr:winged-helix domain-containing protein [Treponema sp.]MCR5217920.1 hypothetical protein [Treponema sp.]